MQFILQSQECGETDLVLLVDLDDLLEVHVGPVDDLVCHVGGGGDDVLDGDGHPLDGLLVEVGHQEGPPVGNDQVGLGLVGHLAFVLVIHVQDVAVHARAVVGTLVIGAVLEENTFFSKERRHNLTCQWHLWWSKTLSPSQSQAF